MWNSNVNNTLFRHPRYGVPQRALDGCLPGMEQAYPQSFFLLVWPGAPHISSRGKCGGGEKNRYRWGNVDQKVGLTRSIEKTRGTHGRYGAQQRNSPSGFITAAIFRHRAHTYTIPKSSNFVDKWRVRPRQALSSSSLQ